MKEFKNKLSIELRLLSLNQRGKASFILGKYYVYNIARFLKRRKAYRSYIINKWHEAFERVFPNMNLPQKSKSELKE